MPEKLKFTTPINSTRYLNPDGSYMEGVFIDILNPDYQQLSLRVYQNGFLRVHEALTKTEVENMIALFKNWLK